MKKFYSLFAAVILAASVNAQTTTTVFSADFDDVVGTGGNDGSWSGTVAGSAATATGGFVYDNMYKGDKCLKGGTSSKAGSLTTPVLANLSGVATLTFRAGAWVGSSEKLTLNVSIIGGGSLDITSVTLVKGEFSTYTVEITGGTSSSKLVFAAAVASNNRFFIDEILVTAPTQAVVDVNATKVNLVKNTVVGNTLMFAGKADVQILNMNGQVVKTASVNENTSLDVATLAKGMYVVTAIVNGKAVTEKIIKK
ncbi:T9SS type A sorting domain-containing protein [Kaistella flava (ex Peng et al. 2021)]|uniref:T9SS type A sorting domain-containing protein n=1 Tax=Kaistella flava (ex Peng et al. 2021) TaxID=2038776 RepID=A0A7M2Y404_9FLAO|nr:T9SS type A sorting domain-containing protein [Kaistella flava (ex Peng et al. 2021)]QOW08958.1 T9SS type A sorting domain-containing protein [Kaistella flava (ex Peng et al. 2021)]